MNKKKEMRKTIKTSLTAETFFAWFRTELVSAELKTDVQTPTHHPYFPLHYLTDKLKFLFFVCSMQLFHGYFFCISFSNFSGTPWLQCFVICILRCCAHFKKPPEDQTAGRQRGRDRETDRSRWQELHKPSVGSGGDEEPHI